MNNAQTFLDKIKDEFNGRVVIIGKGPSAMEWDHTKYKEYFKIGINEASNLPGVQCAFSLDVNNFDSLVIDQNKPLISSAYPNIEKSIGNFKIYQPSEIRLEKYFSENAFAFNLDNNDPILSLGKVIPIGKFSSSVLINLLAVVGFREIVLIGIDGGLNRASIFSYLTTKPLASVQNSYNEQFDDIRLTKQRFPDICIKSSKSPKNTILIGAEKEQLLAEEVLKYSINSRTFLDIDYVKPEINEEAELYKTSFAGTPFSFQRFQMPELASYQGRGVYFDSDMQVFGDVFELFNFDMKSKNIVNCEPTPGRPEQYSVFLAELSEIRWSLSDIMKKFNDKTWTYEQVMKEFIFEDNKEKLLPMEWNSLEQFEVGKTKNIHYTDMGVQPWLSVYNPRSDLWVRELCDAINNSNAVLKAFESSLENGWVRPSLRYQVEHEHLNPWTLPRKILDLDKDWIPPHLTTKFQGGMTARQRLKWTLASYARRLMQSKSYQRAQKVKSSLKKMF